KGTQGKATLIPQELETQIIGLGETGAHRMTVTCIKNFVIGTRRLDDIYLGSADLKAWGVAEAGEWGENLDGLAGIDFLKRNGALIDFNGEKLWLRPAANPPKKAR